MEVSQHPDNRHLAFLTLGVLPTARRQGLATRLLREVARVMVLEGRTLLMFVTEDAVPAGAVTAEHLGGGRGLEASTNQLEVSTLDRNLLRCWQTDAPAKTFELGFWLQPVAELLKVIAAVFEPARDISWDDGVARLSNGVSKRLLGPGSEGLELSFDLREGKLYRREVGRVGRQVKQGAAVRFDE